MKIESVLFLALSILMLGCTVMESTSFPEEAHSKDINVIERIRINGAELHCSIKGENTENPLLLVLHGGPGDTSLPLVSRYNKELEKYYTVVVLEQRGAGKSYYPFSENEELGIADFVEDTYQLTLYLLERFSKEKLTVTAHSWGSVIGMRFILEHPEVVTAYVGCGQVIDMRQTTAASYQFALDRNTEQGNERVVARLEEIDCSYQGDDWLDDLLFVTREVVRNGGSLYTKTSYNTFIWQFLVSREYSFADLIRRQKGSIQSIRQLWPELMTVTFEGVDSFEVPVIFIEGRHDFHASSAIVERFYNNIRSEKQLLWFEESAHFPQWTECDKYNQIVINLLSHDNSQSET